jgi:hypothetical protein
MMIRCIVLLLVLMMQICHHPSLADNPTAIVKPYDGPDPGYIIATSDGGLANRLRVLVAYIYVGQHRFDGAHLVFVWNINDACPGHFLQFFHPIDRVIFTDPASAIALYPRAKKIYAPTRWPLKSIFIEFRIPLKLHAQIEEELYEKIKPTKWIMQKVDDYVKRHDICNHSAMHIRATDMEVMLGTKRSPGNLERRFWFIEGQPKDTKVFLSTDSPVIQQKALTQFPDKILIYERISSASEQKPLTSWASEVAGVVKPAESFVYENKTLPLEHRFTSLESALIDLLIAAHAKQFKGSPYSSYSELIDLYRKIGRERWGWCAKVLDM